VEDLENYIIKNDKKTRVEGEINYTISLMPETIKSLIKEQLFLRSLRENSIFTVLLEQDMEYLLSM